MTGKRHRSQLPNWAIPTLYASIAILAGMTLPRFEGRLLPHFISGVSVSSALAIYTSVGTGMLAMTGVVFSLVFVMVQFSTGTYSPRLVSWIARDRVIWHSLGVFTATFLYSIAAIAWLDRNHSGKAPLFSAWLVLALLLASVGMFIALVEKIAASRCYLSPPDDGRGLDRPIRCGSGPIDCPHYTVLARRTGATCCCIKFNYEVLAPEQG